MCLVRQRFLCAHNVAREEVDGTCYHLKIHGDGDHITTTSVIGTCLRCVHALTPSSGVSYRMLKLSTRTGFEHTASLHLTNRCNQYIHFEHKWGCVQKKQLTQVWNPLPDSPHGRELR